MKATLTTLEGVPEAVRTEYELKGDKYVLKLEGDYPGLVKSADLAEANAKLAEFRDTNIARGKEVDALTAKLKGFEGVDPADYKAVKAKLAELEQQGVRGGEDVAARVTKAVEAAVGPLSLKLQELEEKEKQATENSRKSALALQRKELESTIQTIGVKAGVDEKAIGDFVRRGLDVFSMDEGKVVAKNGDTPLFSKVKPAQPLSVEEWASDLKADAPHLFKPSKGGGATGSGSGTPAPKKTIGTDPLEFGKNLEGIAKGEIQVSPN